MQVKSCQSSGMEVSPKTYNACTFEIIDKWDPTQHAKTCDTMFYLRDGTGAYVWDCDHWKFLDFSGFTNPDWESKVNEKGYIENKPFQTLSEEDFEVINGVLKSKIIPLKQIQADWNQTDDKQEDFIKNKPIIPEPVEFHNVVDKTEDRAIVPKAIYDEFFIDNGTVEKSGVKLGGKRAKTNSVTIGYEAEVTATEAVAIGGSSKTQGQFSVSIGFRSTSNSDDAVSIGGGSNAQGIYSIALGNSSKTNNTYSTALGAYTKANNISSTAIGAFSETARDDEVSFGTPLKETGQRLRFLANLKDPSLKTDAATKNYVDTRLINIEEAVAEIYEKMMAGD